MVRLRHPSPSPVQRIRSGMTVGAETHPAVSAFLCHSTRLDVERRFPASPALALDSAEARAPLFAGLTATMAESDCFTRTSAAGFSAGPPPGAGPGVGRGPLALTACWRWRRRTRCPAQARGEMRSGYSFTPGTYAHPLHPWLFRERAVTRETPIVTEQSNMEALPYELERAGCRSGLRIVRRCCVDWSRFASLSRYEIRFSPKERLRPLLTTRNQNQVVARQRVEGAPPADRPQGSATALERTGTLRGPSSADDSSFRLIH